MDWENAAWHWCGLNAGCYGAWADHWQTMIAGLIAVGAASWAAWLARGQLAASRGQVAIAREQLTAQLSDQADQRMRAHRAARASLPGVLTAICNHAESLGKALDAAWPQEDRLNPGQNPVAHPYMIQGEFERFPAVFIAPLQAVLQYADDQSVIDRVASIFREAQVLDARTRPLAHGERITLRELAQYVLEAAALYARTESLFNYARGHGETADGDDLWPRVFAALNVFQVHTPAIRELARQEIEFGLPPGEADTQM